MQGATVQELLKSSDYISEILDSLKLKLTDSNQSQDHHLNAMGYLDRAIDLKMSFRFLVDGIETNRSLVQVQKQQIERKKVFIQGLQYYKATLKSQIQSSKVDLSSLKEFLPEQPTPETDWIQDFPQQQSRLLSTLQQFKQRKTQYQQKQAQKQQLIGELATQQEKYKKTFPQQVKKLYGQVAETSKLFSIKEVDALAISEFKSKKIQQIHSILFPLKLKELIDIKHVNQFDTQELEITIEKGNFSFYNFARENKIMIEEKQMRFYIASVQKQINQLGDKQEILAVSISRREDFTTQEIFNNLLLQEKVQPVYPNPTTQAQRNTNTKYSQLNWIGEILGSTSCLINGNQFIEKIKTRVFNLNLIKYAVDNIAKKVPPYFFPVFSSNQEGVKLTSFAILASKKIMVTKCEKTVFDEYRKQIYVPEWVMKAINNYEIMKEEQRTNKGISLLGKSINTTERQLLNIFIEKNNLEELESKDFYSYYRFELAYEKNLLTGFFLIPTDYPNRRSVVKLTNSKPAQQSNLNIGISKGITLNLENDDTEGGTWSFSEELKHIEIELNDKISQFLYKDGKKISDDEKKRQSFLIYFQINRLLSLFVEKSLHTN